MVEISATIPSLELNKKYHEKMYIYAFGQTIYRKCDTHGKIKFRYTDQPLNEDTVRLQKALKVFPFSPLINASGYRTGKYIFMWCQIYCLALWDLCRYKKRAQESEWQTYRILLCSRAYGYLTIGIKSKIILGQKLMQMGDYRLDHLVGFDLHRKKVELLEPGK
jgi:D-lactate dehydrogenase